MRVLELLVGERETREEITETVREMLGEEFTDQCKIYVSKPNNKCTAVVGIYNNDYVADAMDKLYY